MCPLSDLLLEQFQLMPQRLDLPEERLLGVNPGGSDRRWEAAFLTAYWAYCARRDWTLPGDDRRGVVYAGRVREAPEYRTNAHTATAKVRRSTTSIPSYSQGL